MTLDILTIFLPMLIAGTLIIATHIPLGSEVIKRGIIFIDLAVAQIAGLGAAIAKLYFHDHFQPYLTQIFAFLFAAMSAYGFKLCEVYLPKFQEAVIGVSYVLASSIALLIFAQHPHGAEAASELLSGQLLWTGWDDVIVVAIVYLVLLACIRSQALLKKYFYFIFAVAITASVQIAGVFLVFAFLIIPALSLHILATNRPIFHAYGLAILSLIIGSAFSLISDLPTGPLLVCVLFIISLISITLITLYRRYSHGIT